MRKVWSLKERELIKTETRQRAIYLNDVSSSDSDFDNPKIEITKNRVQNDDAHFTNEPPTIEIINQKEGGEKEHIMSSDENHNGFINSFTMNVETSSRKGYGSRVGDESTMKGETVNHAASINFNEIEHQTF